MSRIRVRILGAAVALLSLGVVLATPAHAESPHDSMRAALQRISDGTFSDSDIRLVKSNPEVAKQVPDPRRAPDVRVNGKLIDTNSEFTAKPTAAGGFWADAALTQYSLTGSVIYDWHHRVEWLADGRYVTQWLNRYDFLTRAQSIIYIRELTSDVQGATGPGWTTTDSYKQRHLEYCVVQYGCYANTYPNSRIHVTGTGTASFEGSPV